MKFAFLKKHEVKALDRALDAAIHKFAAHDDPDIKEKIVWEALRIAQLRAHRFYSDGAKKEALDYLKASFNV